MLRPSKTFGTKRRRVLTITAGGLALTCLLSLAVGASSIPLRDVIDVLLHPDGTETSAVVRGLRLPRTLVGLAAGAALGMAGTLIQGLTRNPLGEPGLLGISAGAALGMVATTSLLGITTIYGSIWFAFAGAVGAMAVVYTLGSAGRGGATPAKLAVAGAAVSAALFSATSAIVLLDINALDRFRFWVIGALTGTDIDTLAQVVPFLIVGATLAVSVAGGLNTLALGEDVARSLGQRAGLIRVRGAVAVTLLAGAAVALCGPVAFVGLVVPHMARALVGHDHRWVLALSAVLGALFLLAGDIVGRLIAQPNEVQAGIVVAAVGAPFFIALVRRQRIPEL